MNLTNNASNLGDIAQGERGADLVRENIQNASVVHIANSLKDKTRRPNELLIYSIPEYMGSLPTGSIGKLLVFWRTLVIVLDALLVRLKLPPSLSSAGMKRFILDLSKAQLLLVAGSGTINQKYLKGTGGVWVFTAFLARLLNVPVVALGQQVGPFKNNFITKVLIKSAFGKSMYFGCRDRQSLDFMLGMGLSESIVKFSGDEGAYSPPGDPLLALRILKDIDCESGFIAIHFRVDGNCKFSEFVKIYAEKIDQLALSFNKPVLFIPMAYQGENDDRTAIELIRKFIKAPSHILDCEDPSLLKACLQKADCAIGVANHFVVFCASVGVPTLAVHSTPYMKQKLVGAEQAYSYVKSIDIKDFESSDIFEMFRAIKSNVTEADKAAYQRLPADYWLWLDRLESSGVPVNR